jgi:hypothetical protein
MERQTAIKSGEQIQLCTVKIRIKTTRKNKDSLGRKITTQKEKERELC